jgi:hypothetical protein
MYHDAKTPVKPGSGWERAPHTRIPLYLCACTALEI